jgi:hypothetical protein
MFTEGVSGSEMAQLQKKSIRKLVTLSAELAERVDKFREDIGAASESDALKALIEHGLKLRDKPEDLFDRFTNAAENGQTIGEIINLLASDHPLVKSTVLNSEALIIYLKIEPNAEAERFYFARDSRSWSWEKQVGDWNNEQWEVLRPKQPPRSKPVNDLDDDIPF